MKRTFVAITILLMFLLITGFVSINPATEEEELVLISAEKERGMGMKFNKKIHDLFDLPVDPLVEERVRGIGEKLARYTDRNDIVYHFYVLNHEKEKFYNAFAAPGGYIYIFDDLVEELDTDDNIAGVLAHEMGHIEAKHSIKRFQGSIGATILMLLGAHMNKEANSYGKAYRALGQLMAEYSRKDERQADELSVKYTKLAGFNPEGTFKALEILHALRKKAPRMKYSFYRSHPYASERIAYLKKYVKGYMDFDSYINVPEENNW